MRPYSLRRTIIIIVDAETVIGMVGCDVGVRLGMRMLLVGVFVGTVWLTIRCGTSGVAMDVGPDTLISVIHHSLYLACVDIHAPFISLVGG